MDKLQILFHRFRHSFIFLSALIGAFFVLFSFQPVSKAVWYEHQNLKGPISVHILEVDPAKAKIELVHAEGFPLHLETTSSMAEKNRALAAINGGFFRQTGPYAGTASGILKINNDWLSFRNVTRGAIGWNKGGLEVTIDRLQINATFQVKSLKYPIMGINQPRSNDEAILYKQPFFSTTLTPDNDSKDQGKEIVIGKKGIIAACNATGNSAIPFEGMVYSMGPDSKLKLPSSCRDLKVKYNITLQPILNPNRFADWQNRENILGGTPVLVMEGSIVSDFSEEKVRTPFLTERHARSAVGIKKNGHWLFVVVDGQQPEVSVGMNMMELAAFMKSIGCEYALNLDGGGSSTLYVTDKVVNIPSGDNPDDLDEPPFAPVGHEREVSDAILIFDR